MNKSVIFVILAFIAGALAGCVVGYAVVMASYGPKVAAVAKLFPDPPTDIVGGQVLNVNGDVITLQASPVTPNPFASTGPAVREVTVTSATVITEMQQEPPLVFQAALASYQKQFQQASDPTSSVVIAPTPPPTPFQEVGISFSDLKPGDHITATAAGNILSSASFLATEIQVQ